jgi:hypothetical protein
MRFCTWNFRSLYRAVSFTAVFRELASCKLVLLCVQKVSWAKGGRLRAGNYNFVYGKEMKIINW